MPEVTDSLFMPDVGKPDRKREQGRYYTESSPFRSAQFLSWAAQANLPHETVLEPFAGSNNLARMLEADGLCARFESYDLRPAAADARRADTISDFPRGHRVCVTNPPWLARNSASRNGLSFPDCRHNDLHKHCLELCLANCRHVAAIVPATFLQSGLFGDRLQSYTLLHRKLFSDTANPVCLALFGDATDSVAIHHDDRFVGNLPDLEAWLPRKRRDRKVRFNDPEGRLGLVSFDNVGGSSIRFCEARSLEGRAVKVSARFFTRIGGDFGPDLPGLVGLLNARLDEFRRETQDVFLTPFKGIHKDGCYRRRMSFRLARSFINAA